MQFAAPAGRLKPGSQDVRSRIAVALLVLCVHACSFDGNTARPPDEDAPDAPDANPVGGTERVTDDVIALYIFKDAVGGEIADVSGFGTPLNLAVVDTGNYTVTDDGLDLIGDTLIRSTDEARKLAEQCASTNALSIEVWIRSASLVQTGPARIVGMSLNPSTSKFVLAQGAHNGDPESRINARLRTDIAGANSTKAATELDVVTTEWMHVVFTRAADGTAALYVDGEAVVLYASATPATFPGALDAWNQSYTLNLGDELESTGLSRTWHGEYGLLAIYRRALSAQEASQNFLAGH